jgi:predicted enzyme related to lactoylglutathione lyase
VPRGPTETLRPALRITEEARNHSVAQEVSHARGRAPRTGVYADLFGWGLKTGDPAYWEILRGGESIGGIMPMPPEMAGIPPHWGIYFQVADCDRTVARATSLGGSVLFGPQDIEKVGRFAVVRDPQGAAFSIIRLG